MILVSHLIESISRCSGTFGHQINVLSTFSEVLNSHVLVKQYNLNKLGSAAKDNIFVLQILNQVHFNSLALIITLRYVIIINKW